MDGIADGRVLLAHDRTHAGSRESLGYKQPAGAAADDERVG